MELKGYSEEDASGLRAMGFKDEQINKLFSLSSEDLKRLVPKTARRPKKQKGEYIISYTTKCQLCGGEQLFHSVASCYKEWNSFHPFYQTGKGVCKVESCSKCEEYLRGLPHTKLIDIILNKRADMYLPLPKILHTEDREFTKYPMMALNYCSLDEHNSYNV